MKSILIRVVLIAALALFFMNIIMPFSGINESKVFTLPGLPRPIAKVPAAIISAGQNTDSYIIRDIANQLMIRSFFMPQAKADEMRDFKTMVFVVGYSSIGMKLQGICFEDEKKRIEEMLKYAKDNEVKVITVSVGGEREKKAEELLRLTANASDYIIGLRNTANGSVLKEIAKEKDISLTLVSGISDVAGPFASAFR